MGWAVGVGCWVGGGAWTGAVSVGCGRRGWIVVLNRCRCGGLSTESSAVVVFNRGGCWGGKGGGQENVVKEVKGRVVIAAGVDRV